MKRLMIVLLLVTGFALFSSNAEAARRYRRAPVYRGQSSSYGYRSTNPVGGFWQSFMEFERAKNAAIFGW